MRRNFRIGADRVWQCCVFAMLGAIMFISKIIMEALPNIHMVGMLTIAYTLVYRTKALIPLYVYVMLNGLFAGFNIWWIPYLYIWTILWGVTMLLPRNMPKKLCYAVYPLICALHGLLFGILYAPAQSLFFGLDFEQTVAWIVAGFPFDLIHALGNFCIGLLIVPTAELLRKLSRGHLGGEDRAEKEKS